MSVECIAQDEPTAAWACDCPDCKKRREDEAARHDWTCDCPDCVYAADYRRETIGWYE